MTVPTEGANEIGAFFGNKNSKEVDPTGAILPLAPILGTG